MRTKNTIIYHGIDLYNFFLFFSLTHPLLLSLRFSFLVPDWIMKFDYECFETFYRFKRDGTKTENKNGGTNEREKKKMVVKNRTWQFVIRFVMMLYFLFLILFSFSTYSKWNGKSKVKRQKQKSTLTFILLFFFGSVIVYIFVRYAFNDIPNNIYRNPISL